MKKFFVTMIALVATLGISAQNDFTFKTNNGDKLAKGSDMTVHVYLDNVTEGVNGFQINMVIPEGIGLKAESVIFQDSRWNGDATKEFSFQYKKKTKDYRAILAGGTGEAISGEGELFCFDLEVTDDAIEEGKKTIEITTVKVKAEDGSNLEGTCNNWEFEVVGTDTGIESATVEQNNAPVYNLAGMLMNGNLQKGIYVQNGKKYIVK